VDKTENKLTAFFKDAYKRFLRPWRFAEEKEVPEEKAKEEEIQQPPKEIIKEVKRVTEVQPVKEITRRVLTVDSQTLTNLQGRMTEMEERWTASLADIEKNVTVVEHRTFQTIENIASPPAAPHSPARIGSTYITGDALQVTGTGSFSSNLTVAGTLSAATGSTIGNLTLADGSITDSGGTIDFNDENLTTTGTITVAGLIASGAVDLDGNYLTIDSDGNTQLKAYTDDIISLDIGGATGEYLFSSTQLDLNDNNITTSGTLTAGAQQEQ